MTDAEYQQQQEEQQQLISDATDAMLALSKELYDLGGSEHVLAVANAMIWAALQSDDVKENATPEPITTKVILPEGFSGD